MRAIMKGLTDAEFERLYGTEDPCLVALVISRQLQEPEKLPLWPPCWLHAIQRALVDHLRHGDGGHQTAADRLVPGDAPNEQHQTGISAVELGHRLGVNYPTAWYPNKRLRDAMTERSNRYRLGEPDDSGSAPVVEVDDVYLGGERNKGGGTDGKTCLLAACERHPGGLMGYVALQMVSSFSSEATRFFRDAYIATTQRCIPMASSRPTYSMKAANHMS
jgi:hypothetical protein